MEGSALVVEGFPMVQLSEQPIANSSRSAIPLRKIRLNRPIYEAKIQETMRKMGFEFDE
jgi:hypothetical protein